MTAYRKKRCVEGACMRRLCVFLQGKGAYFTLSRVACSSLSKHGAFVCGGLKGCVMGVCAAAWISYSFSTVK